MNITNAFSGTMCDADYVMIYGDDKYCGSQLLGPHMCKKVYSFWSEYCNAFMILMFSRCTQQQRRSLLCSMSTLTQRNQWTYKILDSAWIICSHVPSLIGFTCWRSRPAVLTLFTFMRINYYFNVKPCLIITLPSCHAKTLFYYARSFQRGEPVKGSINIPLHSLWIWKLCPKRVLMRPGSSERPSGEQ